MKRVVIFLIILFILDFSVGHALQHFYFKQESGLMYRTTYSIEKTNANLLVFGSSRSNHHYEPGVFETELKLNYYNVGRDGNYILYHYAVLEAILKRYKPKMILLDVSDKEFIKDNESYERLSCLLPYYKNHPEIRPMIELRSKYEKYKLLSSIYPFNSTFFTIAIGNTEFNKKRKQDVKGYIALYDHWKTPIETINGSSTDELDPAKINYYKKFITTCKKFGVKLYIIHSPQFYKLTNADVSIEKAKNIALNQNTPFYDFSKDTLYLNNSNLFADAYHLNNDGAKLFSKKITDLINYK